MKKVVTLGRACRAARRDTYDTSCGSCRNVTLQVEFELSRIAVENTAHGGINRAWRKNFLVSTPNLCLWESLANNTGKLMLCVVILLVNSFLSFTAQNVRQYFVGGKHSCCICVTVVSTSTYRQVICTCEKLKYSAAIFKVQC